MLIERNVTTKKSQISDRIWKKKMGERKGENLKDRKKFVVVGGKNSVFTFFLSDIRMVQSPMHAMYGYR